jgi:hypothetical protein
MVDVCIFKANYLADSENKCANVSAARSVQAMALLECVCGLALAMDYY